MSLFVDDKNTIQGHISYDSGLNYMWIVTKV